MLVRVLVRHGYEVTLAENGEEAIGHLGAAPFDLIISDMKMAGMSGLDVAARIRDAGMDVPIVLITAHGDTELMRSAFQCGITDFIPKPFNIETVPLIVERNLERYALQIQRDARQEASTAIAAVQALALSIDAKETHTSRHSRRVAGICGRVGDLLSLSIEDRQLLDFAAQVHDVGKIAIPDSILNKPDKLTPDEWVIIRQHPARGAEIVGRIAQLSAVSVVVRHHHEWYDGTGYPDGLRGTEIPRLSRILSVVDAYEVMTSARVYQKQRSHDDAIGRLMAGAGTQFDRAVVGAFALLPEADHEFPFLAD